MKSKLITVFIVSTLSTLGLCSTISYASDKEFFIQNINQPVANAISTTQVITNKLSNNTFNNKNLLNVHTIDHILNKPLFSIDSTANAEYIPTKTFNKNEFFEFALIFNDKLQQFLSLFNVNNSVKYNYYLDSDKPNNDTTIKLISDCDTKTYNTNNTNI